MPPNSSLRGHNKLIWPWYLRSRLLWFYSYMWHSYFKTYRYKTWSHWALIQNILLQTKLYDIKNPLFDMVVKGLDHCDLILGCATVPCPYIYKYIYIYTCKIWWYWALRQISSGPASLYQKKNWRKFDISPFMKGRQLKIKLL
jgi:hypothetical protein